MSRKSTWGERADALETWADAVAPEALREIDVTTLRAVAELAAARAAIDDELTEAVRRARLENHTWSEIGAMLGVSKQAAQRKYA